MRCVQTLSYWTTQRVRHSSQAVIAANYTVFEPSTP